MCLGIAHVSGKVPLSGQGVWQIHNVSAPFAPESVGRKGQIHCVSARPLVPREGLYQIHGQSLNTHRGKHRSGGAQGNSGEGVCRISTRQAEHWRIPGQFSGNFGNFVSIDSVNIWCIVFFPVLKPLACGIQSRCLNWVYKLPGGQKFSIKLSPLSVGFPERRPLNLIERPQFINSPRVRFIPPCLQLINKPCFCYTSSFCTVNSSFASFFRKLCLGEGRW